MYKTHPFDQIEWNRFLFLPEKSLQIVASFLQQNLKAKIIMERSTDADFWGVCT